MLSKGYEVHGIVRRVAIEDPQHRLWRIRHLLDKLILHPGSLENYASIFKIVEKIKPDEVYNLGAQSHVRVSFDLPEYTGNVTALGTTRLLDIVRRSGRPVKFYQASSSEMFGMSPPPQNEDTPMKPRSPYACAKVYAYWMARNYRDGYGMFVCNGIMFNHESPRRGETFVTRKITGGIARILSGKEKYLYLGNLEAKRDWGYAPEYVECMWQMLNSQRPDDYVVGTGESHSVQEFLEETFSYAGLKLAEYVKTDPRHFRPTDVEELIADSTQARRKLGWSPKIKFKDLVKIMVGYIKMLWRIIL